ncbi:uncharacterized protein [Nicotiana sylvestris]|uniref:uncharacterized protein n=1 Tax=Nicotiana sylvestris TaxID=4096 RepID=UPI00388C8AF3
MPQYRREELRRQFEWLRQEDITVSQYELRFSELALHAIWMVLIDRERIGRFVDGLTYQLCILMTRERVSGSTFEKVVDIAREIESVRRQEREEREADLIVASHICYPVAEANFEPYSDTTRLCLVGADHLKFPRTYASPEAIQDHVDPSKEASSSNTGSNASGAGGTSRFHRFSFGSQLLQKTIGLVLIPCQGRQLPRRIVAIQWLIMAIQWLKMAIESLIMAIQFLLSLCHLIKQFLSNLKRHKSINSTIFNLFIAQILSIPLTQSNILWLFHYFPKYCFCHSLQPHLSIHIFSIMQQCKSVQIHSIRHKKPVITHQLLSISLNPNTNECEIWVSQKLCEVSGHGIFV